MSSILNRNRFIGTPKQLLKRGNKGTILKLLTEIGFHHNCGKFIHNIDESIWVTVKTASKSKKTMIDVGYFNSYSHLAMSLDVNEIKTPQELSTIICEAYEKSKSAFR